MTGRDIVTRLPDADEKRIRLELSGNLCRCTGYVGIVKAIQSAQAAVKQGRHSQKSASRAIGPVGSHPPDDAAGLFATTARGSARQPVAAAARRGEFRRASTGRRSTRDGVELRQSFSVPFPRDQVWRFFADLDQVARCMPGARLTRPMTGSRAEGEVNVKLGPIVSAFQGTLDVARDDSQFKGIVRGAGRDTKSPSSARAIIAYGVQSTGRRRIAGRRVGQVPADRCACTVQPVGPRQGRRRPSHPRLCAKSRSPAVGPSGRDRARRKRSMPRPLPAPRSWSRISGFFRRLWNG